MSIPRSVKQWQLGATLIELIVFIIIVSVALAGVISVLNVTTRASGDPLRRKQALAIAEGLLEEVQLARFTYCDPADLKAESATSPAECTTVPENVGPEAGNVRPYDNVNDYVTKYGVYQSPFNDKNGKTIDLSDTEVPPGYQAKLKITQEKLDVVPLTESLRITVMVTYDNNSVVLDGYRTRYAPTLMP